MSANYQTDANARGERIADIIALRYLGETLDTIGQRYGISRERVRQILEQHAPDAPRQTGGEVDPIALLKSVRRPEMRSVSAVAREMGMSVHTAQRALTALGVRDTVQRLFRWRRRAACRRQVVASLQRFAAEHGRPPTVDEMNGGQCGSAYSSRIYQGFRTVPDAFAAAGLTSRPKGWRGRLGGTA